MIHSAIADDAQDRANDLVAGLPKADLHIHQEWSPRLDRVLARRGRTAPYDWDAWRRWLASIPPGMPRLAHLSSVFPAPPEAEADDENVIARLEDLLTEEAEDGAVLVEVRVGPPQALRPDLMDLIREAERRVQCRYPRLMAEAVVTVLLADEPERLGRVVDGCIRAAGDGLGGVDLLYEPYDAEANWTGAYRLAARMADAGLGITAHAGEFSTANIAAALETPGLGRLGHAVYAARDPRLLDLLLHRGVTVECSLTCNVVLGAVAAYEEHPIRQFVDRGIPVALGTDDPVQVGTTIGHEYALASRLGFSPRDLLEFTVNGVRAAFTSGERRAALLSEVEAFCSQTP